MTTPVRVDGARGEGGGQIVRTSLSLAALTGTPIELERIRDNRSKPGLLRQHLTALRAISEICTAEVSGDQLGSRSVCFRPGPARAGDYHFAVGSAGSASLVLQTVLWPLVMTGQTSRVVFEGGTHNPFAPTVDFITRSFLPVVAAMGVRVDIELERYGFYPRGGGRFVAEISPCAKLEPLSLTVAGPISARRAVALVANLPRSIAERELHVVAQELRLAKRECEARLVSNAAGAGNALMIEIERPGVTELVTAFGERGVPAEKVARQAARAAAAYVDADVPVGVHLADQLIIPMALAGGGGFATLPLSAHTLTNIAVVEQFLSASIAVDAEEDRATVSFS